MVMGHWIPVQFSYEEIFWTFLKSYGYWKKKKDINESRSKSCCGGSWRSPLPTLSLWELSEGNRVMVMRLAIPQEQF